MTSTVLAVLGPGGPALADLLEMELERIRTAEGKGISGLATGYTDLDKRQWRALC